MQLHRCLQLLTWMVFFLANKNAEAQIRNLHNVATIIPDSLVKEKLVGGTLVKFVEEKYLQQGWNEFSHQPGRFSYISYKSGKIRSYYLSDTTGAILTGSSFPADSLQYEETCFGPSCFCLTEKNCAALFAANKEKTDIVCVGNTCFFTRLFDAFAYKKEYLKKLKAEAAVCNKEETATLEFSGKKVFLSGMEKRKLDNLFIAISKTVAALKLWRMM